MSGTYLLSIEARVMVQLVPYATFHSKLLFPHFVWHDQLLTNPAIEEYTEHIKAGDAKVQSTMTYSNIHNGEFNRGQCYRLCCEINKLHNFYLIWIFHLAILKYMFYQIVDNKSKQNK